LTRGAVSGDELEEMVLDKVLKIPREVIMEQQRE
jgi:hypothetical protein